MQIAKRQDGDVLRGLTAFTGFGILLGKARRQQNNVGLNDEYRVLLARSHNGGHEHAIRRAGRIEF